MHYTVVITHHGLTVARYPIGLRNHRRTANKIATRLLRHVRTRNPAAKSELILTRCYKTRR